MFDKDAMRLYKTANEAYTAPAAVKNEETAECLRAVVGLDIRFMVGCDQVWDFSDDDDQPAAQVGSPAAASGRRKRTIEATAEDTEDEEETLLVTPISRKRGRKPR